MAHVNRIMAKLHAHGTIVLTGVALLFDLDEHAHDAVVVLLESGQLLLDMTAEPVRDLAVTALHDNVQCHLRPFMGV